MPIGRERPPNLKDALVLVAATAVGFAAVRSIYGWYYRRLDGWPGFRGNLPCVLLGSVWLFLAAWTPALIEIRLARPRPLLARLTRQPGFAASVGASAALVMFASFAVVIQPYSMFTMMHSSDRISPTAVSCGGMSVAGCWALMAVGGRWRAEATWIDRLGRLLGFLWLTLYIAMWAGLSLGIVRPARIW